MDVSVCEPCQQYMSIVFKFSFCYVKLNTLQQSCQRSHKSLQLSIIHLFTDNLLCHDDQLEGRRVAFIYYLVSEWMNQDGGLI